MSCVMSSNQNNLLQTIRSSLWDNFLFSLNAINPFKSAQWHSDERLDGKIVVITGANRGIGRAAAIELASRGAKVILACRDTVTADKVAKEIIEKTGDESRVLVVPLDLSSLKSVRECASNILKAVDRIDILINNAGIVEASGPKVTSDGFEETMQINHYGPVMLTKLLLPLVKASPSARIIFTASSGHRMMLKFDLDNINSEKFYSSFLAYCKSKLANILVTNYLASQLKENGITVNSLCPGPVDTDLASNIVGSTLSRLVRPIKRFILRTPEQGAQTIIYLAVEPSIKDVTGQHFYDCKIIKPSSLACDFTLAQKLWEVTEKHLEPFMDQHLITDLPLSVQEDEILDQ